ADLAFKIRAVSSGGGRVRVEFAIGAVGENPVEGDQNKVSENFLFDAALGFAVKVLDFKNTLACLVKLLDAPPAMIGIDELVKWIALRVEQGGSQAKYAVADVV